MLFIFLGMFAKLQKVIISLVMSVFLSTHLSVHPYEQLSFHWMDLREILYLSIFWKSIMKIKFL